MTVRYSPLAQDDLLGINEYISIDLASPKAAKRILGVITKRIRGLEITPEIGTPLSVICNVNTDYRFLVCESYIVFYRYTNGIASIIRVLYGRMNYLAVLFGDDLEDDPIDLY